MRRVVAHLRTHVVRGLVVAIPLVLSLLMLRLIYVAVDRRAGDWLESVVGIRLPGLGLLVLVVLLYLLGVGASNMIGRQLLRAIDRTVGRIPLVKTTYQIGQQLGTALSLPEGQVFRRAVLVEFLREDTWTIGFVTGSLELRGTTVGRLLKVFVPTPPNPTSGTLILVDEARTRDPGWTIEQALRTVVSAGIIGPAEIEMREPGRPPESGRPPEPRAGGVQPPAAPGRRVQREDP